MLIISEVKVKYMSLCLNLTNDSYPRDVLYEEDNKDNLRLKLTI